MTRHEPSADEKAIINMARIASSYMTHDTEFGHVVVG